jgi:hypothetical protein
MDAVFNQFRFPSRTGFRRPRTRSAPWSLDEAKPMASRGGSLAMRIEGGRVLKAIGY